MWPKRTAIALFAMGFVGCDRSPVTVPATNPTAEKSSIPSPANKRMHFEHQEFVLDLDSSWARVAGNDPEQFQFESKSLASMLTISVVSAGIPQAKLRQTAEKLLELRRKGEAEADRTRVVTLGDQWVTPKPDEQVVEVAYAGFDNRGRIFRFMGFVTTQKVLTFYCETVSKHMGQVNTADNEQAKRIFDESFRGFKFYAP
jgi:hypothetical protein